MQCSEVRTKLVAWRDGELGASEQVQVEEHVAACPDCARRDRALTATLPRPRSPVPPAAVRARFEAALDPSRVLALADRAPPARRVAPTVVGRLRLHLGRPAPVSVGAAVVYLALLAGSFGWGLSNWWSVRASAPSLQPPASTASGIPADQFRPASYEPGADQGPR